MDASLIAPCGMNCAVCIEHLRKINACPGCRGPDEKKPVTRVRCKIKTCEMIRSRTATFCFQCGKFPCDALRHLDKRYQERYQMSMIANLTYIRKSGLEQFMRNERVRWICPGCGGTVCVHTGSCSACGKKISKRKSLAA